MYPRANIRQYPIMSRNTRSTATVSITLPHRTLERLDSAARQDLRSRSSAVQVAVERWLSVADSAPAKSSKPREAL